MPCCQHSWLRLNSLWKVQKLNVLKKKFTIFEIFYIKNMDGFEFPNCSFIWYLINTFLATWTADKNIQMGCQTLFSFFISLFIFFSCLFCSISENDDWLRSGQSSLILILLLYWLAKQKFKLHLKYIFPNMGCVSLCSSYHANASVWF